MHSHETLTKDGKAEEHGVGIKIIAKGTRTMSHSFIDLFSNLSKVNDLCTLTC